MKRLLSGLFVLLAACSSDKSPFDDSDNPNQDEGKGTSAECTDPAQGREHLAFDGKSLNADRVNVGLGQNRMRVKSYSVMTSEFERVLGALPPEAKTVVQSANGSFESYPVRWFGEPQTTGVGMTAYFEVAFRVAGYHIKANPTDYGALPTAESARKVCDEMAHKAWRRKPGEPEVTACVDYATTKLANETNPARRWSYVIASVLSTADFLSY
jgi:hypothetical protein